MEDLSSEISQKMRSAVKAKLMELGGNTYIDDELPDYVMIMVANKRSRQQMITDLTLFLDSQTELFVTWLHEVLTKLQAVTEQPAALTPSKKKKETKKKEKKKIADVVAEDCIIKSTNQHVEVESTKKEERSDTPPLPTITEMVVHHQKQKAVESNQKQKELVEIQKKIIETKKKIQEMDETEEPVEMEQAPKPVKKSIAERIGTKEPKRRNKREDRELYVPTNRRSDIHHDRKIGSRVIKAPPKVEVASDGEEHDKTVCSIIKVKPRPKLSPTRQPSKNLLLKAMADAQKSAVQATKDSLKRRLKSRSPSPLIKSMRGQKLYTKSYRNRMNRDAIIRRHIGKTKDNIVVHVKGSGTKEEYIPEPVSDKNDESDNDYVYIPQQIESKEGSMESLENVDYDMEKKPETTATQFVVTLDDSEEFKAKFKNRLGSRNGVENKNALFRKVNSPTNDNDRQSPIVTRQEYQEKYLKQKEIKKIIIRNDSEDDEGSSPRKMKDKHSKRHTEEESDNIVVTPPRSKEVETRNSPKPQKRKRSPITFDLKQDDDTKRKRSRSRDKEHQIISIRKSNEFRKFDNIPDFLMPIPVDKKPKERCKFYPACTKFECEFFHPLSSCKAFPNCKFAEKCLYIHPKCKYDVSCTNNGCNYSHTRISTNAPPLSSHVVPVQNYKSINPVRSSGGSVDSTMMCKYYPHCTNNTCNFYHPKPCKFGWNCLNKLECNFYHPDVVQVRDKFKWVASAV